MSFTIRMAHQNDMGVLCNLMEEISGHSISLDQMADRLKVVKESKSDSLFICEDNNEVLGLFGFRIRENLEEPSKFGEVSVIVVHPSERHRGVGRFMMGYAEKLAKEHGCKGTWLVSGFGREEKSHKFYKRLGYQINGYRFVKSLK